MRNLTACAAIALLSLTACSKPLDSAGGTSAKPPAPAEANPRSSTIPPLDANNIVSIAIGSKDHTTLVAALKAADYVTSVANPGPLTVFAPTNAAFDKLPKGTVEKLVQPDQQAALREILKFHVAASVYDLKDLKDGMQLGMANGARATVHVQDGKVRINDANVVATVRASNGIVHIVDTVLLPPQK